MQKYLGLTYGNAAAHHDYHHTVNKGTCLALVSPAEKQGVVMVG